MAAIYGFGFRTQGTQGLQFRSKLGRVCSASAPEKPNAPVWISGPGFDWVSHMEPDVTLVPGVFRSILDAETQQEVFRLICGGWTWWTLRGPGADVTLEQRDLWYGFRQHGRIIGILRPYAGPVPRELGEVKGASLCLRASFNLPPDPKTLAALLAFPLLKFL
jgi:hypothetical protein